MNKINQYINFKKFFYTIVLPTLVTICLFVFLIFLFIIPYFEQNMIAGKKEMIKELVNTAISIANKYERELSDGLISKEEATQRTISRIENLRYGVEDKDYFWITDTLPNMIMHPYRKDLNYKNLSDFSDPNGKKLFVEMVNITKEKGEGYVDYMWQWMDDSNNIVPKISYVKLFKPWGWIIGTGVYIEDIRKEISGIKQRLSLISLSITLVMIILLSLIVRQNLRAEIKRSNAENELKISREKYKALVEVSTEGTAMILDNVIVYTNKKFNEIFKNEFEGRICNDISKLIYEQRTSDIEKINQFCKEGINYFQLDTQIVDKNDKILDVLLSISKVEIENKKGYILIIKELRSDTHERELRDFAKELIKLSDKINFGVFRLKLEKKPKLVLANYGCAKILGYEHKEELLEKDISEIISIEDAKRVFNKLKSVEFIEDFKIKLNRKNRLPCDVTITAIAEKNHEGKIEYIFGIFKDVTEISSLIKLKNEVYNDIKESFSFLNLKVKAIKRNLVVCNFKSPVREALKLMADNRTDYIIIYSDLNKYIGILTDFDIITRVIDDVDNFDKPVGEFMSSPIFFINENSNISEAILIMSEKKVGHLLIKDEQNNITGIINEKDIVQLNVNTSEFMVAKSKRAKSIDDLKSVFLKIPFYTEFLLESGARTYNLSYSISKINDALTIKLCELIIREIGEPPIPFSFIVLGSEGRREQTLYTDQDNAIIYNDATNLKDSLIEKYFLTLGSRMSDGLNNIGYNYCDGGIMAKNIKWCQPLSKWKNYFSGWISNADSKDILEFAIFFDLRFIYGDNNTFTDLVNFIYDYLEEGNIFISQMARVCSQYKVPIGLFGKIQTETADDHSKTVNLKNPIRTIVNIVRLYTIKYKIKETNTLDRLRSLYEMNFINSSLYNDLVYSYDFLMHLQFKTQVKKFMNRQKLDNNVDLTELSSIELNTLKDVLHTISTFQSKVKFDFGIKE